MHVDLLASLVSLHRKSRSHSNTQRTVVMTRPGIVVRRDLNTPRQKSEEKETGRNQNMTLQIICATVWNPAACKTQGRRVCPSVGGARRPHCLFTFWWATRTHYLHLALSPLGNCNNQNNPSALKNPRGAPIAFGTRGNALVVFQTFLPSWLCRSAAPFPQTIHVFKKTKTLWFPPL